MAAIEIRLADEYEKDLAADLLAGTEPWTTLGISHAQCSKNCHDPEFLLHVALVSNEPAGFILIDPRGVAGSPYIKSIAVYNAFRGQGIGSALLSFSVDCFRNKARYIFICVSSFNHRARHLYEKSGFQAACDFKDYIIDGASETLMQKRL
jgi:ribosomal protein S18 acetylase RimI-like enzyme